MSQTPLQYCPLGRFVSANEQNPSARRLGHDIWNTARRYDGSQLMIAEPEFFFRAKTNSIGLQSYE